VSPFSTGAYRTALHAAANRRRPLFHELPCLGNVLERAAMTTRRNAASGNNAFKGVESELMSYAPGSATSPTTYHTNRSHLETETSAEISRNWVLNTVCTACCASPKFRPLTSSGPASGTIRAPLGHDAEQARETPPQRSNLQTVTGADDVIWTDWKIHGIACGPFVLLRKTSRPETLRCRCAPKLVRTCRKAMECPRKD